MVVRITNVYKKNLPALRLIGKRCDCGIHNFVGDWDEWFENGWFEQLERLAPTTDNGDMYLGVTDNNGGYWIGLLFLPGTPAPDGFEYAEILASKYAVCEFEGKKDKELLGEDGIKLIIEETEKNGLKPELIWHGWCMERYSRPNPQDGKGKVLFDCLCEIQ